MKIIHALLALLLAFAATAYAGDHGKKNKHGDRGNSRCAHTANERGLRGQDRSAFMRDCKDRSVARKHRERDDRDHERDDDDRVGGLPPPPSAGKLPPLPKPGDLPPLPKPGEPPPLPDPRKLPKLPKPGELPPLPKLP